MKNSLLIIFVALFIWSCKEDQKKNMNGDTGQNLADTVMNKNATMDDTASNASEKEVDTIKNASFTGVFIRSDDGKEAEECQCNCLEVNLEKNTRLCIDEKTGLSISADFKKNADGSLNLYYVGPIQKEGIGSGKIPWDKFDKTIPIATIVYSSDDAFKLNWKGFSIDGELAVDYAIYGKKNLEGNYVKK